MSRYYGHVLINFMDGTSERIGGNRADVRSEGTVLTVYTDTSYSGVKDHRFFVLANVRDWQWES